MDAVLDALGGLLLKALPTFILFFGLHFYLKLVLYRPLDRVLGQRWQATEGARRAAAESMTRAEQRTAEYEEALRRVRAEIAREQEQARERLRQEQRTALAAARKRTAALIDEAKARLATEAEQARQALEADSEALAEQITTALLERRAS